MGTPNWPGLYRDGRCKDIGVPWDNEELHAIYTLEIPVDYVRDGILTTDEFAKALEKEASEGKKPLSRRSEEELLALAQKYDVKITPDVTKVALVKAIKDVFKRLKVKAEQAKAVKTAMQKEKDFQIEQSVKFEEEKARKVKEKADAKEKKDAEVKAAKEKKDAEVKAAKEKKEKEKADAKAKKEAEGKSKK